MKQDGAPTESVAKVNKFDHISGYGENMTTHPSDMAKNSYPTE